MFLGLLLISVILGSSEPFITWLSSVHGQRLVARSLLKSFLLTPKDKSSWYLLYLLVLLTSAFFIVLIVCLYSQVLSALIELEEKMKGAQGLLMLKLRGLGKKRLLVLSP